MYMCTRRERGCSHLVYMYVDISIYMYRSSYLYVSISVYLDAYRVRVIYP